MPIDPEAALMAERAAFHQTLTELEPDEWDRPSLCDGWRVRDVASHGHMAVTWRTWEFVTGMARARGDFDRFSRTYNRRLGDRPVPEILASMERATHSAKGAPLAKPVQSAIDIFVHHHDIAVPLGRAVPVDPERLRWMADGVVSIGRPLGWGTRLKDLRLLATDIDWHYGTGPEVRGPAAAIILAACRRDIGLDDLEGDGVAVLAARP